MREMCKRKVQIKRREEGFLQIVPDHPPPPPPQKCKIRFYLKEIHKKGERSKCSRESPWAVLSKQNKYEARLPQTIKIIYVRLQMLIWNNIISWNWLARFLYPPGPIEQAK